MPRVCILPGLLIFAWLPEPRIGQGKIELTELQVEKAIAITFPCTITSEHSAWLHPTLAVKPPMTTMLSSLFTFLGISLRSVKKTVNVSCRTNNSCSIHTDDYHDLFRGELEVQYHKSIRDPHRVTLGGVILVYILGQNQLPLHEKRFLTDLCRKLYNQSRVLVKSHNQTALFLIRWQYPRAQNVLRLTDPVMF